MHKALGGRPRPRSLGMLAALAAAVIIALVAVSPAHATLDPERFGIESFTTGVTGTHDAGGHPDVFTSFEFKNDEGFPYGTVNRLEIDLPVGLVGDPTAVPRCDIPTFFAIGFGPAACPPQSQVGVASLWVANAGTGPGDVPHEPYLNRPIYNLVPPDGSPALLGIAIQPSWSLYNMIQIKVLPNGGLRTIVDDVPLSFSLLRNELTLWGVPADRNPLNPTPGVSTPEWPRVPFMTSPTTCDVRPTTVLRATTYQGKSDTASFTEPTAPENCASAPFDPSIVVKPENRTAGAPSAVHVDILLPQNKDPDGQATSALRDVVVDMPEGLTINPGTARDLSACSDAEFAKDSSAPARCPKGSKIGTIGITTPLLFGPMPGDIYLAEPKPGERFRLFLYGSRDGVRIKIPGTIHPDPETGRLTAVFRDNPQLPFTRMHLRFRGGNNAVLALPPTCGTKTTTAGFSSWGGVSRASGSSFQIYGDEQGAPCPEERPFAPTFTAGTTTAQAGADTGLTLTFARGDRDQYLGKLRMHMPAGLLGRLADFPRCPIASVERNECSDASLVGGVTVASGVGDALLNLPGKVFLTEPFKEGQIAGLGIVVRAVAGPYDLGTVVVKTGIVVNPDTSLSVESDPLPTMLEGVALRIRQVTVNVDRPGFMFNPTDCSPKRIDATIVSTDGAEARVSSPFQVRGCNALEFSPPMTIEATAPADLTRVMGLEVNLGGIGGQANARQVQVVLPPPIGARLDGPVQTQCTEAQFAADACSPESRVGTARADTPILSTPLVGDVFFLENVSGGNLPRLAVRLKGEVLLDLVADVEITAGGRYTTTFGAVPDVPISNFRLKLEEGSQAILTAAPICGKKLSAERNMIAHNGKFTNDRIPVTVAGCPGTKTKSQKASQKKSARKGKAGNKRRGA